MRPKPLMAILVAIGGVGWGWLGADFWRIEGRKVATAADCFNARPPRRQRLLPKQVS
jgi:hypothetical protein